MQHATRLSHSPLTFSSRINIQSYLTSGCTQNSSIVTSLTEATMLMLSCILKNIEFSYIKCILSTVLD